MKTIWKYTVHWDEFTLEMQRGAQVLSVQVQDGVPRMWAIVDPGAATETRHFRLVGTGHTINDTEELRFIGTFQIHGGELVFHLFERVEDPNEAIKRPDSTTA